jgi:methionyl-tRNA synthetase
MNIPSPPTIEQIKQRVVRPKKALITSGMPYANGPVHIGHLAGTAIPADIMARFFRMLIGSDNVLFVCGSDDHGSTTELTAAKSGESVSAVIERFHAIHSRTFKRYAISVDNYSGTSRSETFAFHKEFSQNVVRDLQQKGMLEKNVSLQWFDKEIGKFLQDRFVTGKCPNQKCGNLSAFSDYCDVCGNRFEPNELQDPKSALTQTTPELRPTTHWWLNMWSVVDTIVSIVKSKQKVWRQNTYNEVINTVEPSFTFSNEYENTYKGVKATLPVHKSKYASGKRILIQTSSTKELNQIKESLVSLGVKTEDLKDWAIRSISRDVSWGIPMPEDVDPEMKGKTFYVWPDSLLAPIAFSKAALVSRGQNPEKWKEYWTDPEARVCQFIGQDNVYFYTTMQAGLWISSQKDIHRSPIAGELQPTDVYSVFHLLVEGEKMSKSTGNMFTGEELLDDKGFDPDQLRYFLASLSLAEKPSNFDFSWLKERCKFLAGPLNAAFEKPISACQSKFNSRVPVLEVSEKVKLETTKIIQKYLHCMPKADYPVLLGQLENYARLINSIFSQFKPHDDREEESSRRQALSDCFYILKQLVIMLYPFAPATIERVCASLNMDVSGLTIDELGTAMKDQHVIGQKGVFFPAVIP